MNTTESSQFVDEVRRLICRVFARAVESGAVALRIRLEKPEEKAARAWFYAHLSAGWEKQSEVVTDHGLLESLEEEMNLLSSKGQGDEWSSRVHSSGAHHDLDLHVHPEKVRGQEGASLEATMMGLLFRDRHDSKKDVRRNIRTQH